MDEDEDEDEDAVVDLCSDAESDRGLVADLAFDPDFGFDLEMEVDDAGEELIVGPPGLGTDGFEGS